MAQKKVHPPPAMDDDPFTRPPGKYVPKDTAHRVDITVRLGKHGGMKPKLEAIAERNGLSLNTLMVSIITWWLSERQSGRDFTLPVK